MQLLGPESWVQILPLPWTLGDSGHIRQLLRTCFCFCRAGILMADLGLAHGPLMPTTHLGTMSGPHTERGRSGSQPLTPACTSSQELEGVSYVALFSPLLPMSKGTSLQPTKGLLSAQWRGTALPSLYVRVPQGGESQEAMGGLFQGQPKTEQVSGSRSRVCHTAPPPLPQNRKLPQLGSMGTSEQAVSGFLPPGPSWHP